MRKLYVVDTNCLIAFFHNIFLNAFGYGGSPKLSIKAKKIIAKAIVDRSTDIRLSIPSIVFVEIYDKWLTTEEFLRLFYYEIFTPIKLSPNIEIRPTDREVLETLVSIGGSLESHDLHDKIILATAMALKSPLMTTDADIIEYIRCCRTVPGTLN